MEKFYNWLGTKQIYIFEWNDFSYEQRLGYMWTYLYERADMNALMPSSNWNFDVIDIYGAFERAIKSMEKEG